MNLILEILNARFIIDPAHFEIHPRARQQRESYVKGRGSLESKVTKELVWTTFIRPVQRLRIYDLGGNTAFDISPLLDCSLEVTTTGNNDYNNEVSRLIGELQRR